MNIIFLGSLICLGSSISVGDKQLSPLKKIANKSLITSAVTSSDLVKVILDHKKDPAYLLSVLSNVDPTKLNDVLLLVRALLAASEADLADVTQTSTTANTAYTDATTAYDAAVVARVDLQGTKTAFDVAFTANSALLDQQVAALLVAQTEAHGAKTNAQSTFDTETVRLNGEIETLKQVIALLEGLVGSTAASNSVPQNGLYSWFKPSSANSVWSSSIGNWEGVASGTVVPTVVTEAGNGASVPMTYLTGTIDSVYNFGAIVPVTFTICSMSRYLVAGSQGRILQAEGSNWLHGHWSGRAGMNYYEGWNSNGNTVSPNTDWLIMCGSSDITQAIYVNGVAIPDYVRTGAASPKDGNLWINPTLNDWAVAEKSDWAVAEIITWDRVLTVTEIEEVSANMRKELSG